MRFVFGYLSQGTLHNRQAILHCQGSDVFGWKFKHKSQWPLDGSESQPRNISIIFQFSFIDRVCGALWLAQYAMSFCFQTWAHRSINHEMLESMKRLLLSMSSYYIAVFYNLKQPPRLSIKDTVITMHWKGWDGFLLQKYKIFIFNCSIRDLVTHSLMVEWPFDLRVFLFCHFD